MAAAAKKTNTLFQKGMASLEEKVRNGNADDAYEALQVNFIQSFFFFFFFFF